MGEQRTLQLSIETLTHGGRGLGHTDGKAVFVPLTAPGDRVLARVTQEKRRYCVAELQELLEPSPVRCPPPCPLFGDCGGCQWQHVSFPEQGRWKERIFADLLSRAGIDVAECLQPLHQAPEPFHYRNRVQFKCRMTAEGFVIGFYRGARHFVVDAKQCLLLKPPLQATLTVLRRWMGTSPHPEAVPQIDVTCGDDGCVQLVVHLLPDVGSGMCVWLRDLARQHDLAISIQTGRKESLQAIHGSTDQLLLLPACDLALRVGSGGFSQVNPEQNRRLVETVCQLAALKGGERILDLFCGVGNFSLPLARAAAWVDGVEAYAPAIEDARRNALANGLAHVEFHADDACRAIRRLWGETGYDLVVVDPPRSGCYQVVQELLRQKPERMIYVSCDPATLARDLQPLIHNGYRLLMTQPFDLFPQTWHIESVTLLQRVA